ncbi:MAG: protease, partial [Tepidisphaeraceae bacterium]
MSSMLIPGRAFCLAILSAVVVSSANGAVSGYYRFPTIHGSDVVFTSEGDLWKASTAGGVATRLTSHPGAEVMAHFSPDGKWIAFTADYQGNGDVYLIPAEGGEPKRLTFHPAREEVAGWTPDGSYILFRTRRGGLDSEETIYKISPQGGEPELLRVGTASLVSFAPDGNKLLFNRHSWNANWKRYRGGTAPDVWIGDLTTGKFAPLIDSDAPSMYPMWIGDRVYFVSERDNGMNLFSADLTGKDVRQVTQHSDYDVRWPDTDGRKIVYTVGCDLYVFDIATAKASKLDVTIPSDRIRQRPRVEDAARALDAYELNDDGKRVVISSRGQVWSAPAKPGGRIIAITDPA